MSLFARFFGREDPLIKRAGTLVVSAQQLAFVSLTPTVELFPELRTADPREWEFFFTVAGVYMGLSTLTRSAQAERFEKIAGVALDKLESLYKDGPRAVLDCREFIRRTAAPASESEHALADSMGMWILHNLYKRAPTFAESGPVRCVGGAIEESFGGWWI